jgi:NitT/TauT family transport system ATP-binding protein
MATASTGPIVSIQNVSKLFAGAGAAGGQTHALARVSLDIAPGEFVSLLGPSGCGKSTLLRLVADLIEPSEGQITVKGKTPRQARLDREYGIVFQSPVLYDWRNVLHNVELPLEVMRFPAAERDQRAREMLSLVGLQDFEHHFPWQLSGGMQQRVSIARALSFRPAILLMDEPFGALDEMTRERMNAELLNIWSQTDTTVIFVTHSIAEAVFLSGRVVVMTPRPGRIEKVVAIDLPRPRNFETREDPHYFELITAVREGLREV